MKAEEKKEEEEEEEEEEKEEEEEEDSFYLQPFILKCPRISRVRSYPHGTVREMCVRCAW